jgi:hypothetical protein
MITFKQYLKEAAVGDTPQYNHVDLDHAVSFFKSKCSNAKWMLKKSHSDLIYRGFKSDIPQNGYYLVDSSKTLRKSHNTTNHYTVLLDNHPRRKNFPKRSQSFICTTSFGYAATFVDHKNGGLFIIIPSDTANIGSVNDHDMWDTRITIFGDSFDIVDLNRGFRDLGIEPNMDSFKKFNQNVKDKNGEEYKKFVEVFGEEAAEKYHNEFLKSIFAAYSKTNTMHTYHTTKNLPRKLNDSELWISGELLMIPFSDWDEFVKATK